MKVEKTISILNPFRSWGTDWSSQSAQKKWNVNLLQFIYLHQPISGLNWDVSVTDFVSEKLCVLVERCAQDFPESCSSVYCSDQSGFRTRRFLMGSLCEFPLGGLPVSHISELCVPMCVPLMMTFAAVSFLFETTRQNKSFSFMFFIFVLMQTAEAVFLLFCSTNKYWHSRKWNPGWILQPWKLKGHSWKKLRVVCTV